MSDDLLLKINADTKDVTTAFENVKAQTEDLEGALSKIAKISGIAFSALTAQVAIAVKAFADGESASLALTNALQNQGIYTDQLKKSYEAYVDEVSAVTGASKDQLTQAQVVAQQYLGQIPITKELTKSIADLAQAQGISLTQAAEEMGKAIGNGTGMLLRQGIQFAATSSEADRYSQVLDFVNVKYGGAATALDPVTLATRKLGEAFQQNNEELGARFAPAIASAIEALTSFIQPSKESSGAMVDLKANLIAVGLVVTSLGVGIPVLAQAFLTVRAALIAMNTQLTLTQALLAGLGIGLLSIAITELVLHFNQVKAVVNTFIGDLKQLAEVASGVGKVLNGAFHFDGTKIKEGLREIGEAFKKVGTDAAEAWTTAGQAAKKGVVEQDEAKEELAKKDQARKSAELSRIRATAEARKALIEAELHEESEAIIAIKKAEYETLKAMEQKQSNDERAILQKRLKQLKADEKVQLEEDLQIQKEFQKQENSALTKHGNDKAKIQTEADKKQLKEIQKNTDTQQKAQNKVYMKDLKAQQDAHNQFLEDQIKYGTAYATINEGMHSSVYQGSKKAFGELAELQQSSNSTLKAIGKVAAVANIVIKTAESAMNIYEGFSDIPIVGPALGIAGAAAAVAFGAEQISKVSAAQTGALVGGVGYGDTQPYMLEPGELVAPKKSFDEVVTGVAKQRGYVTDDEAQSGQQNVSVMIGFDGRDAQQVLTARRVEDKSLGVYRARS